MKKFIIYSIIILLCYLIYSYLSKNKNNNIGNNPKKEEKKCNCNE